MVEIKELMKLPVEQMSVEQLIEFKKLVLLATKATKDEKRIKKYKGFQIRKKEVSFEVDFNIKYNYMYYYYNCTIILKYDGQLILMMEAEADKSKKWKTEMKRIDKESIFELYKAEWLVAHGLNKIFNGDKTQLTEIGKKYLEAKAFKRFIKEIKKNK